jgi:AraC-like DNA-binding protein
MMKAEHGGHDQVWNERMRTFAKYLANEFALEKDISIAEATKLVEKDYAGMHRNKNKDAFAISPEAQQMLLSMLPPKLEDHWRTANSMHNELGISDGLLSKHFRELENKLIGDTQVSLDVDHHEAKQLIHHNVIGDRKPSRGPTSLAAGPDAQRLVLEDIALALPAN